MSTRQSTPRASYVGVLRNNPAFARLYAAQLISFCGDWFAVVALQGLLLDTAGPALAGAMLTVQLLPTAFASPFAGVLVDRLDRRLVMIVADVARGALALGFLFARDSATLWIAFVCAGSMSALAAFFDPAASAALPNLVREEDLPLANVLNSSAWGIMLAVGAAIGGGVAVVFGRDAAFIGNAVSFGVSALLLMTVRARFSADGTTRTGRVDVMGDVVELIRFARTERHVGSLLLVKAGFGLAGGVLALISVMATDVFDAGDRGIGIVMSARGVGVVIGPFLFRRLFGTSDRRLFAGIATSFLVFAFGYLLFGVSPALWVAALGACIAHIGGGAQWALSSLGLQRYTPDRIRGRVFAADYSLISLSMGISLLASGALAGRFGPRPVALALASLGVAWSLAWTILTRRTWPDREGS